MSPRTGRPTTEPKGNRESFRLSDNDIKKLKYCVKETGKSKAEIVRMGIESVCRSENLKREEVFAMKNKYNGSFEVDMNDVPNECPICHTELDLGENVDTSPYKDGFRSVLMCPKCNFQKVLSYTTEKDVEMQMKEEIESDS